MLDHLFLPLLTLTLGYVGQYAIIMRSSMIDMMNEDYVQTARAKGVPERLVRRRHVVPNAFLPAFTLIFLSFGFVLGGAIVIESVFSWPGLGLLTYQAINTLDYPVIQGVFLIASAAVIVFNLVADVTYGYLDPRIRAGLRWRPTTRCSRARAVARLAPSPRDDGRPLGDLPRAAGRGWPGSRSSAFFVVARDRRRPLLVERRSTSTRRLADGAVARAAVGRSTRSAPTTSDGRCSTS